MSRRTIQDPEHHCRDRSIAELCASFRLGVLHRCLRVFTHLSVSASISISSVFKAYQMLTSVLEG